MKQEERRPDGNGAALKSTARTTTRSLTQPAPGPEVSARLVVDLSSAVDESGFLMAREVWRLVGVVPAGVRVLLKIGSARHILDVGEFGEVLHALRPAGSVEVEGSDVAGLTDVTRRLRVAFPKRATS